MQITIFGASGKVGLLLVSEALTRGYSVRAFTHSRDIDISNPNLSVIKGDINDAQVVAQAIDGSHAVVSALGSWGTSSKDIVSRGMRTIIPAMEAIGVERIVSLTGSDAHDSQDNPSFVRRSLHTLIKLVAGKILVDGETHIKMLRASSLDWTVLRSPVMTNGARIFYKLSLRPVAAWQPVARKAVAKAMLDQLDGASYSKAAPFIHRF